MTSLEPFTGILQREIVEVPRAEITENPEPPSRAEWREAAQRLIAGWELEPIVKPLERLAEQAKGLAALLGRGEVTCAIEL